MPRKSRTTQDLNPPVDATNDDIIAALGENKKKMDDVKQQLDEVGHTLEKTHKGFELNLWGQEVDDVE